MNPRFKDKKVENLIMQYGDCYTIKRKYESQLSNPFQKVVFAVLIEGDVLNELKDVSPELIFESLSGKKISVASGNVITTTADSYDDDNEFLLFYEETTERIKEQVQAYFAEKNAKKGNKPSVPRRKVK